MIGPIRHGEGSVTWSSRSEEGSSPHSPGPGIHRRKTISGIRALASPMQLYFTPDGEHVVDASPLQITDLQAGPSAPRLERPYQTAPPKLGGPTPDDLQPSPALKFSLDHHQKPIQNSAPAPFKLDEEAPVRAIRGDHAASGQHEEHSDSKGKSKEIPAPLVDGDARGGETDHLSHPGWGECFKIEWLERRKLPFHRTRHLRNQWNKGREIKISRDGTELEPTVGKKLLEEWEALVAEGELDA